MLYLLHVRKYGHGTQYMEAGALMLRRPLNLHVASSTQQEAALVLRTCISRLPSYPESMTIHPECLRYTTSKRGGFSRFFLFHPFTFV